MSYYETRMEHNGTTHVVTEDYDHYVKRTREEERKKFLLGLNMACAISALAGGALIYTMTNILLGLGLIVLGVGGIALLWNDK